MTLRGSTDPRVTLTGHPAKTDSYDHDYRTTPAGGGLVTSASVTLFLYHSRATGTAKVVGIGIGEHDGDGGSFPSHPTLARYANVSVSNVKKAIKQLEDLGEIKVHERDGGGRNTPEHERPNRYEVLLRCPPNCDGTRHHRLLCPMCRKPLPPARIQAGMHVRCMYGPRPTEPPVDTPTPYQIRPGVSIDPGSAEYPHPGSETGSELNTNPPTQPIETSHVVNRESYPQAESDQADLERWLESCPGRWRAESGPHELNRHGNCSHCLQPFHVTPDGGLRPGKAPHTAGSRTVMA